MVTLFNVVSSDGFISRPDGSEDFIPDEMWPRTLAFMKEYDAIVMGRKTYDTLQSYGPELLAPFEALPLKKVVVTNQQDFSPKEGYTAAHTPEDALAAAPNVLVVSGPGLNTYLLEHGLVRKVVFHEVPVAIGEGIRPFSIDTDHLLIPIPGAKREGDITVREYRTLPLGLD